MSSWVRQDLPAFRVKLKPMIPFETLRRLYRTYMSWYRIGHDRSLAVPRSIWSLELALQPATPIEARPLAGLPGTGGWSGTPENLLWKSPLQTVVAYPRLDRVLTFPEGTSGLKAVKVQVQLLLAPEDREFREDFSREEGWMWLLSAGRLTELFLTGVLSDEGLQLQRIFHSCYRTEQNREVTEDLLGGLEAWDRTFAEVSRRAGPGGGNAVEPNGSLAARRVPLLPSRWERYRLPCEDVAEAGRLAIMCRDLGLDRLREVRAMGSSLDSRLEPLELADVLSFLRHGGALGLFHL